MRTLLLLTLAFGPLLAQAQSVFFHFTDGSTVSYPITDVRSTDFEGGNMRVFLWDGTSYSWSMSSLTNYQFNDVATTVPEANTTLSPLELFPNPTSGEVTIGFEVHGEGEVRVEVLDLRGATVRVVHQGKLPQGAQRLRWDGHDAKGQPVASGNYLCRVVQGPRAATKQVIVQR
jgi:flagellar hook assembly protein FlgD